MASRGKKRGAGTVGVKGVERVLGLDYAELEQRVLAGIAAGARERAGTGRVERMSPIESYHEHVRMRMSRFFEETTIEGECSHVKAQKKISTKG